MTATKTTAEKAEKEEIKKKAPAAKRAPAAKKAPAAKRAPAAKKEPTDVEAAEEPQAKSVAAKTITGKSKIKAGNYIYALGRRKSATAQTRLYPSGKGEITVNGQKYDKYFVTFAQRQSVLQPLEATGRTGSVDVDFRITGGGMTGQAGAARLGLSRALIKLDQELRKSLKKLGYLTRDAREKERKKYGLKKARRAPQWAKR